MNGVNATGMTRGWPATTVMRLNGQQPVVASTSRNAEAEAALLAGVAFPPRVGEARPIGALLPEVLARYGLGDSAQKAEPASIDCLA